jgi:hypothetical protein
MILSMAKHIIFIILMLLWSINNALAQQAKYSAHIKSTYEMIHLPKNEPMGLFGIGALFEINRYISVGPEIYGALYGKRGGFFTVGIEGQAHMDIGANIGIQTGLFAGAGGGGCAPQGGGLMLRPSLGISYDLGIAQTQAGISRVSFPNGNIDSTQIYGAISVPLDGTYWRGHEYNHEARNSSGASTDILSSIIYEHYIPGETSHAANGQKQQPFSLAGVEFKIGSGSIYGLLHTAGAGAGSSNGYMEIFGGAGFRYTPSHFLSVGIQGAMGAAGGGRVDTGGGLMYRSDVSVEVSPLEHFTLGLQAGIVGAFKGSFSAKSYGAKLGYTGSFYGLGDPEADGDGNLSAWRFSITNKSYLPAKGMFKDDQVNRIDLIGLSLHRFLNKNLYLIGESFWAWQGQAGGYAEGIFGLGCQTESLNGFRLYAEAKAGVGGGGDVHMDGGIFGSIEGGMSYDIDDAWQIHTGAGYTRSKTGGFHTQNIQMGISYNFSLLGR